VNLHPDLDINYDLVGNPTTYVTTGAVPTTGSLEWVVPVDANGNYVLPPGTTAATAGNVKWALELHHKSGGSETVVGSFIVEMPKYYTGLDSGTIDITCVTFLGSPYGQKIASGFSIVQDVVSFMQAFSTMFKDVAQLGNVRLGTVTAVAGELAFKIERLDANGNWVTISDQVTFSPGLGAGGSDARFHITSVIDPANPGSRLAFDRRFDRAATMIEYARNYHDFLTVVHEKGDSFVLPTPEPKDWENGRLGGSLTFHGTYRDGNGAPRPWNQQIDIHFRPLDGSLTLGNGRIDSLHELHQACDRSLATIRLASSPSFVDAN
jgi:hypothetical protein